MAKIKSLSKLPNVDIRQMSDGIVWVFLYFDESKVTEINTETGNEQTIYEYDFSEFHVPAGEIDIEDLKSDPEKYRDYTPMTAATEWEKIEAQVLYTAAITDTLLED